jgi:hypothetical protein
VVVIHGVGDIKRNATLNEAVNALAYWFNHVSGLDLRRDGAKRIWVAAQPTDDPSPDAPAARASIDLVPAAASTADHNESGLHLEFREVWWAKSFDPPSVGSALAWAWVQAREQAWHLLLPIGRRLGPAQAAARTPAREIAQAATYRPHPAPASPTSSPDTPGHDDPRASKPLPGAVRFLLLRALGLYSVFQYLWKALQWLILTPLILLLLLLMGVIRLLALIPPFQTTVLATFSALLKRILLHWIAEAQVYMLDYTRSAGIRERFEHEVEAFLRDERCERVVVIGHSMGTVIGYEGLTTVLARPEFHAKKKPLTFICLAQALRRLWLMTADDPHRLRGVLPDYVRWLHFWARYDPVAAGPLSARSLERPDEWPNVADHDEELRKRLGLCDNVDVVNADSAFTDHTTYWENLEQVVGPIARELVTGHPALERFVDARLASADDVLRRRWRVAWRATLALVGGTGLGIWLGIWDWTNHLRVGHALATSFLGFLADLLGTAAGGLGKVTEDLQKFAEAIIGVPVLPSVDLGLPADTIWSVIAVMVVSGVGILLFGRMLAPRSPLAYARDLPVGAFGTSSVLVFSGLTVVGNFIASLIHTRPPFTVGSPAFIWYVEALVTLALIILPSAGVAVILAFVSAVRSHRWDWCIVIAVPAIYMLVLVISGTDPRFLQAQGALAQGLLIGSAFACFLGARAKASRHEFAWMVGLAFVGLSLAFESGIGVIGGGGLIALPPLLYALSIGASPVGGASEKVSDGQGYVIAAVLVLVVASRTYSVNGIIGDAGEYIGSAFRIGALLPLGWALIAAVRSRRLLWLGTVVLVTCTLFAAGAMFNAEFVKRFGLITNWTPAAAEYANETVPLLAMLAGVSAILLALVAPRRSERLAGISRQWDLVAVVAMVTALAFVGPLNFQVVMPSQPPDILTPAVFIALAAAGWGVTRLARSRWWGWLGASLLIGVIVASWTYFVQLAFPLVDQLVWYFTNAAFVFDASLVASGASIAATSALIFGFSAAFAPHRERCASPEGT